ncbi:MAG: universal stress protein [Planctomycetales bacterium]|nr:universal stress protein [Planctomycetales bacterium]
MLERVLVPLDGSAPSSAALARLRPLLREAGGEVALLHVTELSPDARPEAPLFGRADVARAVLGPLRDSLAEAGIRASVHLRTGDAASEILRDAAEWGATLVAMSTHGRTGLARVVRGSVAEAVLRRSPVPVLTLNPALAAASGPGAEGPFRRILLPLDASPASSSIVPQVAVLAAASGAEVVLLHVLEDPGGSPSGEEVDRAVGRAIARLRDDREGLERDGIRTRLRALLGRPEEAILEAVRDDEADLLAMTTHGRTGLSRAVYGSVAESVLRRATVPVLLRRPFGSEAARAAPAAAAAPGL